MPWMFVWFWPCTFWSSITVVSSLGWVLWFEWVWKLSIVKWDMFSWLSLSLFPFLALSSISPCYLPSLFSLILIILWSSILSEYNHVAEKVKLETSFMAIHVGEVLIGKMAYWRQTETYRLRKTKLSWYCVCLYFWSLRGVVCAVVYCTCFQYSWQWFRKHEVSHNGDEIGA